MDSHLEKIREVQKEAWNKSSAGWKKWDEMMMTLLKPVTAEIIHMLRLRDDDMVMDVATGTGEPGLTIASMLKQGKVTGTDLAESMLAVAEESGTSTEMMNKIADMYEGHLDRTLSRVLALAQPVILILMGGIIGGILLAVLLPLTDMSSFSITR